jgi:hypothetical protein
VDEAASLFRSIKESWPKWSGLLLGLFGLALLGSLLATFLSKSTTSLIVVGGVLALLLAWYNARRLRLCPLNKYGFVIAIHVEDVETQKIFEADFSRPLVAQLRTGALAEAVWVYVLPQFHMKGQLSVDEAIALRVKTRSGFVLFGQVRTRVGGEKTHHVDLHGAVGHAPTDDSNKARLTKEFSELLPRKLQAAAGQELPVFELTSAVSSLAVKYIAGIAAFLSGDRRAASALYSDCKGLALELRGHKTPELILERLDFRESEVAISDALVLYREWRRTHSSEHLERIGDLLDGCPSQAQDQWQWRGLQAIRLVAQNAGNLEFIENLMKKMNPKDAATQMNFAFLDLLRSNFKAATRHYRNAVELHVTMEVVEEVMEFLDWYGEDYPQYEAQVQFGLGYISYLILEDSALAKKYFGVFDATRGASFENESRLAKSWIATLKAAA